MGKYVEQSLLAGERILYQGKSSLRAYWFTSLLGLLLSLGLGIAILAEGASGTKVFFFLIFAWFLVLPHVARATTELAITNKKIIAKFGVFSRKTIEINLSKTESIQVVQGIFGRMMNYGSLIVSGAGIAQAPIPNIEDPIAFKKAYQETIDMLEREQKGGH